MAKRQGQAMTRRVVMVAVASTGLAFALAMAMVPLPTIPNANTAGASTRPNWAAFTFNGALKGTLHGDPCGAAPTPGGQFEFDSHTLKGSKAETWTVQVNIEMDRVGTYRSIKPTLTGVAPASVVLTGQTGTTAVDWISTSGSISTSTTAGHLKVTLGPDHRSAGAAGSTGTAGKGVVTITGSWNCPTGT